MFSTMTFLVSSTFFWTREILSTLGSYEKYSYKRSGLRVSSRACPNANGAATMGCVTICLWRTRENSSFMPKAMAVLNVFLYMDMNRVLMSSRKANAIRLGNCSSDMHR